MKLLSIVLFFASSSAWSNVIPDGTYEGKGRMRTAKGLNVEYQSKLIVQGDSFEAIYNYGKGKDVTYKAELKYSGEHFFEIFSDDEKVGTGYSDGAMIHMDITEKDAEETLFVADKTLKRIGSMKHGETLLMYTEILQLK